MRKREGASDENAKKVKTQHSKIKYWKTSVYCEQRFCLILRESTQKVISLPQELVY